MKVKAITICKVPLTAKRHERILAWVNTNRKSRGLKPIKQLRSGPWDHPRKCPLARSLNAEVRYTYKSGNGEWSGWVKQNPMWSWMYSTVPFPKFVHEFHEQMRAADGSW